MNVKMVDGNFCLVHGEVWLHIIEETCFLKFRIQEDINLTILPPDSISHCNGQTCGFGNTIAEKQSISKVPVFKIIDKVLRRSVAYKQEHSR